MIGSRGSLTTRLALVGVVLAAVAVGLVGAAAMGSLPGMASDAQPDAETILDRAEDRYANADTVVGEANVTASNGTVERSVTVSYAVARPDRVRVGVDGYAAGTNGSVAWVDADGVVLSTPVVGTDAAASVPTNGSAALAADLAELNRSALLERILTMAELNASYSGLPANVTGQVPANASELPQPDEAGAVPPNWTERVPANWSERLPANWTDRLPANWSDRVPANWTDDYPANWTERVPANWTERVPANWTERVPANWTERVPANWSDRVPANWTERVPANWTDDYPANWSSAVNATGVDTDRNYTWEVVGTETVDGSEAYVLAFDRVNATTPWNVTLWVDTQDYRFHRAEATFRESRLTVDFDTTFNASVRNSTFQPPDESALSLAGRTSYDSFDAAQTNTSVDLGRLDGNFTFVNATVATQSGVTVTVQQYTDGERTAALVSTAGTLPFDFGEGEPVTVAGANATYVERDDRSAVVWEREGVTRAVVADLPREELVALAESAAS